MRCSLNHTPLIAAAACCLIGCRPTDESPADTPSLSPRQSNQTEDLDARLARLTSRADDVQNTPPPADGWLRIDALRQGAEGGWITGGLARKNKIVIDTDGVERFVLDLSKVHVDWNRRVVLRIDGAPSELAPKKNPLVTFARSSTGGWDSITP